MLVRTSDLWLETKQRALQESPRHHPPNSPKQVAAMICHLQMRTPRLKLWTVACKLERGQADDLSVSKPLARPASGVPFCRCANSIHLGSTLCQMRFLPQSFNLKVPGTVSSHCFQPLSEKFPPKSSERARAGRRN